MTRRPGPSRLRTLLSMDLSFPYTRGYGDGYQAGVTKGRAALAELVIERLQLITEPAREPAGALAEPEPGLGAGHDRAADLGHDDIRPAPPVAEPEPEAEA